MRCAAVPVRLMTMVDAELADQMEMVSKHTSCIPSLSIEKKLKG